MNTVRKAALEILQSDFFAHLRGVISRGGLPGEEMKVGMIIYFVMISSFRPNPLRLALLEKTEGGTEYVVRRVAKLFEPGTICGVWPEHRWLRFKENPTSRVAYVRRWSDGSREGIRFEVDGNKLSRVSLRECEGRIIPNPDTVEGNFAFIAEHYPWESFDRPRWLTMELPPPPTSPPRWISPLTDDEIATWKEVQRLLQERSKVKVVLPDWADVLVERVSENEHAARHLPFLVRGWQTMTMLRSFAKDDQATCGGQTVAHADFDDLAITSLLLRSTSKEGRWFPSPKGVFNDVFPVGHEQYVVNPLNGKGVRYSRDREKSKLSDFESLV